VWVCVVLVCCCGVNRTSANRGARAAGPCGRDGGARVDARSRVCCCGTGSDDLAAPDGPMLGRGRRGGGLNTPVRPDPGINRESAKRSLPGIARLVESAVRSLPELSGKIGTDALFRQDHPAESKID
jgi:hypothetical protein